MAILPVSSVNLESKSIINFAGDKEVEPKREPKRGSKAAKYASVPVIVLMTMNPSLSAQAAEMNSPKPKQITMEMPYSPTEIDAEEMYAYDAAPVEAPQASYSAKAPFGWESMEDRNIVYSTTALGNGEKRYLVFTQSVMNKEKEVSTIYFIKAGSKSPDPYTAPPRIREFIYHDLGKKDEYCSVKLLGPIVQNGKDMGNEYYEERIDDQTAQILIDLLSNKSEWTDRTRIKFSVTKDPNIAKPERVYD